MQPPRQEESQGKNTSANLAKGSFTNINYRLSLSRQANKLFLIRHKPVAVAAVCV